MFNDKQIHSLSTFYCYVQYQCICDLLQMTFDVQINLYKRNLYLPTIEHYHVPLRVNI